MKQGAYSLNAFVEFDPGDAGVCGVNEKRWTAETKNKRKDVYFQE
jgi:hypothetical protein